MKVIVASTNPAKLKTTELGFAKMFPNENIEVRGVSVESGVSAQPLSDKETLNGATQRVDNVSRLDPEADFWVGIEGGVEETNAGLESFAWVVVKSRNGQFGSGRSGTFFLPTKVADLIRQGIELGEADDIVFDMKDSKKSNGAVGILTGNILTRASFYEHAVILALIPFKNPELY